MGVWQAVVPKICIHLGWCQRSVFAGDWNTGHDLLWRSGRAYTAAQPDLALYDQMKIDYAGRL